MIEQWWPGRGRKHQPPFCPLTAHLPVDGVGVVGEGTGGMFSAGSATPLNDYDGVKYFSTTCLPHSVPLGRKAPDFAHLVLSGVEEIGGLQEITGYWARQS